jgi:hypothetical protein
MVNLDDFTPSGISPNPFPVRLREKEKPVLIILERPEILQYDSKIIEKDTLVFTPETWKWCRCKYKKGKKTYNGCRNFNHGKNCPPAVHYQGEKVFDFTHFRLVWVTFAFKRFKELRKKQDRSLSDGMAGNSNQWQGAVKKRLFDYINRHYTYDYILGCGSGFGKGIQSAESAGMHVYKTCETNQIPIASMHDITYNNADIRFFTLLCNKDQEK